MIGATSLQDPEAAARLALLATWCATADRHVVFNPPRFLLGSEAESLALDAAAMRLSVLAKPLGIDARVEDSYVRVHAEPVEPGTNSLHEFYPYIPPLAGDPDQANILIVGGRTRLRVTPRVLDAASSEYWLRVPSGSASDFVGSGFVSHLELPARDLEGIAQVIVLGRSSESGWDLFVPPAGAWDHPAA